MAKGLGHLDSHLDLSFLRGVVEPDRGDEVQGLQLPPAPTARQHDNHEQGNEPYLRPSPHWLHPSTASSTTQRRTEKDDGEGDAEAVHRPAAAGEELDQN